MSLSVYLYRKKIVRRNPYYLIQNEILYDKGTDILKNVRILMNENEMENFCVTRIAFFNNGNAVISGKGLAKEGIFIEVSEKVEIHDLKFSFNRNPNSEVIYTKENDEKYRIQFDFLEPSDGFVLEIYFSFKETVNTKERHLEVKGYVIGENAFVTTHKNYYILSNLNRVRSFSISILFLFSINILLFVLVRDIPQWFMNYFILLNIFGLISLKAVTNKLLERKLKGSTFYFFDSLLRYD